MDIRRSTPSRAIRSRALAIALALVSPVLFAAGPGSKDALDAQAGLAQTEPAYLVVLSTPPDPSHPPTELPEVMEALIDSATGLGATVRSVETVEALSFVAEMDAESARLLRGHPDVFAVRRLSRSQAAALGGRGVGPIVPMACSHATAHVNRERRVNWLVVHHESQSLYTTGCGWAYTIRARTNDMDGPTCVQLRVMLYPSNGNPPFAPRGWLYVCPGSGMLELANYIIPGTHYKVESRHGRATVYVEH
mgnify:CR=1 FL=1